MPIAFILVLAAFLVGGWYHSHNYDQKQSLIIKSEANAIATNMLTYKDWIGKVVKYQNAEGHLPNYERFKEYIGDAKSFIAQAQARGDAPEVMTWFKGPMPGVQAQIRHGEVFLLYNQNSPARASEQGVQAELLRLTHGSYGVGKTVGY